MLEIEKWAADKPRNVALMAQFFAVDADAFYLCFGPKKNNKIFSKYFAQVDIDSWLQCYKNHKKCYKRIIELYKNLRGTPSFLAHTSEHMIAAQKTKKVSEDNITANLDYNGAKEGIKLFIQSVVERSKEDQVVAEALKQLETTFQDEVQASLQGDPEEYCQDLIGELLAETDFMFLLFALSPCILFYNEHPTKLYRKARQGNLDALDKLLRVDKLILCDPRISKHIALSSHSSDNNRFDDLSEAIKAGPKIPDLKNVKFVWGGIISVLSELMGHRLSASVIQELFYAVAMDSGTIDPFDEEPMTPQAFAKQIQRVRKKFNIPRLLNPDKK